MSSCLQDEMGLNCVSVHTLRKKRMNTDLMMTQCCNCYTTTGKTFRLSVGVMTDGFIVLQCDCTVWQVLQHVKRSKAVYSVISHIFSKLIRKP